MNTHSDVKVEPYRCVPKDDQFMCVLGATETYPCDEHIILSTVDVGEPLELLPMRESRQFPKRLHVEPKHPMTDAFLRGLVGALTIGLYLLCAATLLLSGLLAYWMVQWVLKG